MAEFDNLFHGEDEDPELDDVAKEAVEDNVPDEAKLEMGHINATSVTELTLILCANEDNEAKAEIEEILNQTVPVVEEHKRKWREAGLDRILDTFDESRSNTMWAGGCEGTTASTWRPHHQSTFHRTTTQSQTKATNRCTPSTRLATSSRVVGAMLT